MRIGYIWYICWHNVLIVLTLMRKTKWHVFSNKYMLKNCISFCVKYQVIDEVLSVQFSRSIMSNSLWPHELQHARPPSPSLTPRVHPNPCPLCWWCHPTISSAVIPFSSSPQSFPASGSFQMSQISASGGQSIGVSASTSVPPMNTQDWCPKP